MVTLVQKIGDGFTRVIQLVKQGQADLNGKIGNLASLNTVQKASLVLALNELKGLLDTAAQINDASTSSTTTYSSNKIETAISTAINNLLNGAGADSDTLKELADKITALAQADTGLVSAAAAQSFSTIQKAQARTNIDAASATDVGDINGADFVATVNTAYSG